MCRPSEATVEEARAETEALRARREEADRQDAPLFFEQFRGVGERHQSFMERHPWYREFMEENFRRVMESLDELDD